MEYLNGKLHGKPMYVEISLKQKKSLGNVGQLSFFFFLTKVFN